MITEKIGVVKNNIIGKEKINNKIYLKLFVNCCLLIIFLILKS